MSVVDLISNWAKELAGGSLSHYYELEDKLYYELENAARNGFLDDPLRNGSRLGFRVIDPSRQPQYMEGRELSGLFRTMDILVSKHAVLDFSRRYKLRPPSVVVRCDQGGSQRSPSPVQLTPAAKTIGSSWFNRPERRHRAEPIATNVEPGVGCGRASRAARNAGSCL